MAIDSDDSGGTEAHVQSYSMFSAMMKWGAIVAGIATFAVVLIIAN